MTRRESDNAPYVGLTCPQCGRRVKMGDAKFEAIVGYEQVEYKGGVDVGRVVRYGAQHWPGKCPAPED